MPFCCSVWDHHQITIIESIDCYDRFFKPINPPLYEGIKWSREAMQLYPPVNFVSLSRFFSLFLCVKLPEYSKRFLLSPTSSMNFYNLWKFVVNRTTGSLPQVLILSRPLHQKLNKISKKDIIWRNSDIIISTQAFLWSVSKNKLMCNVWATYDAFEKTGSFRQKTVLSMTSLVMTSSTRHQFLKKFIPSPCPK